MLASFATALAACGSEDVVVPDAAPSDRGAVSERAPDDAPDAASPGLDVPAPSDDGPTLVTIDAPEVLDANDVTEATDASDVVDASDVIDAVGDAPDAAPGCQNDLTDLCPAPFPGPCASLSDGLVHTVSFAGLTSGLPASCEGAVTAAGPDGVIPLTITTPSDVVVTAHPAPDDAVVLTLSPAGGCGVRASELRCANSSAGSAGGVATVRATGLGPGDYTVTASTAHGGDATIQAAITPARPRSRGDVCPGVALIPDGGPVVLPTTGFATEADHGTACGSNGTPSGWVDSVFSYALTTTRDVTLTVGASGAGDVAVGVTTVCGDRATAVGGCLTGNVARRVIRNQGPGTYYVVAEYRSATGMGRTLTAAVTTAPPTTPGAADLCPGVPLAVGGSAAVDVAGLTNGSATFSCFPNAGGDAVFGFTAPAASDLLVNVAASDGGRVGYTLRTPCNGAMTGGCTGPAASVWRRYQGLTTGQGYSLVAGTDASSGTLTAQLFAVPVAASASVTGNETCDGRLTLPVTGGVFRGNSSDAPTVDSVPCGSAACPGGRAVYFQLTLAERRRVVASTVGSTYDTILSINHGDDCPGTPVTDGCNDDTVGRASQVDLVLDAGSYYVVVQGCGMGRGGDYALDLAVLAPTP